MKTVTSKDGTSIAFDKTGQGPALVLVGGAFEQRAMESETAKLFALPLMAQHFTMYHYDRRGRGDSTDTQPYAVEREIEDVEAIINEAGGSAFLVGISSGAALAMQAAAALGTKVKKLAMYEPPYNDDADARQAWKEFRKQVGVALAEGRNADAVGLFMMLVGVPAEALPEMQQYPMWPQLESVAPTLAYEGAVLGEDASIPTALASRLTIPTLVMNGGQTYPFMVTTAAALSQIIPNAQHRVLEDQPHEVAPEALAPLLIEFFA